MSNPVLEIVKLESGDIVLRRSDDSDNHIVTINFADQVQNMPQETQLLIAQSMIQAGINTFRELQFSHTASDDASNEKGLLH